MLIKAFENTRCTEMIFQLFAKQKALKESDLNQPVYTNIKTNKKW
jgi:hypothetical protein